MSSSWRCEEGLHGWPDLYPRVLSREGVCEDPLWARRSYAGTRDPCHSVKKFPHAAEFAHAVAMSASRG